MPPFNNWLIIAEVPEAQFLKQKIPRAEVIHSTQHRKDTIGTYETFVNPHHSTSTRRFLTYLAYSSSPPKWKTR